MHVQKKLSTLFFFVTHFFVSMHGYESIPNGSSVPIINFHYFPTTNNNAGYDRITTLIKHTNTHQHLRAITHIRRYKSQDFQNYFAYLKCSEQEILSRHQLYMYEEFIRFIKTLSGYELYVASLHKKISKMSWFKKLMRVAEGKHYRGLTEKVRCLHEEMQKKKNSKKTDLHLISHFVPVDVSQSMKTILETQTNQVEVAAQFSDVSQQVFNNVRLFDADMVKKVEPHIDRSIAEIRSTKDIRELAFHTIMVDRTLSDMQAKVQAAAEGKPTLLQRSPELIMRGVTKFVCALNPVTQIKSMGDLAAHGAILLGRALMGIGNAALHPCQTVDDIAKISSKSCELLATTACFVSDLTVGVFYLMPHEYQQRINVLSNAYDGITNELQKLTTEQVVDVVAQLAADIVFAKGSTHVYAYLKELESAMSAVALAKDGFAKVHNKTVATARRLKNAIDTKIEKVPTAVTPEGIVLKIEKGVGGSSGIGVGGGAAKTIQKFSEPVERIKNTVKNNLDAETIKNLEKAFGRHPGFDKFAHKEIMPPFEHLLTMENLKWCHKGKHKLGGLHHDFRGAIEESKAIFFTDKVVHENGCYTTCLIIDGSRTNPKTFFPKDWSPEVLVSKLGEAYKDFEQKGRKFVLGKDEKYRIQGFTKEGIEIEMIFSVKGKMLTAYPLLK